MTGQNKSRSRNFEVAPNGRGWLSCDQFPAIFFCVKLASELKSVSVRGRLLMSQWGLGDRGKGSVMLELEAVTMTAPPSESLRAHS